MDCRLPLSKPLKALSIAVFASIALALGIGIETAGAAPPPVARGAAPRAAVHHDLSPALRNIPPASPGGRSWPARPLPARASARADAVRQALSGPGQAPTLGLGFDGMGNGFSGPNGAFTVDSAPPDPAGAVGPNNYMEIVNEGIAVFNKSGTAVYGPVSTKTLWSGFGGLCESHNDGDGTVSYDRLAGRWVVSQFALPVPNAPPYLQCVAVSQTSDPTGSYYRYSFSYSEFPDYPKLAVWPDAYYTTFNMFGANGNSSPHGKVCAYDRSKMLSGQAATQQCFDTTTTYGGLLASDLDGPTAPPGGSPNYVVALGATTTSLAYWKFHVDWTTPGNSTFTGPTALTVSAYSFACGGGTCIPQSGTNTALDSLGDRLMYRLAYRNFGDHEALVVDHSVTAGSAVGVRWYELRVSSGNLSVFQQGTFAPADGVYRWMGSAAMDKNGDIALGYSASSSSQHPSIRYTARVPGDPAGTMGQGEGTVITGAGSQTQNLNRWGDYTSLTVDPSGDCTFWYVNQYIPANGSFNWRTRIATFNVSGCGSTPSPPPAPTGVSATASDGSVSLSWSASSGATSYKVFRGTSPGGEGASPVGTPSGTSFNDTGRTNGTTYYYKVAATNAGGDSPQSSEVSATPVATPTGLTATGGNGSVSLSWSASAGATGYRVYRGTSPGGEGASPVGTPSGTSFNDTGLTNGNTYYYKVAATNSSGASPQSSEAHATLKPPAPTGVSATPGDGSVSLSWSAANGATSYKVYRGTSPGGEGASPVGTPSGTSFNDTGRTNGTTYYYKVAATNAGGDSPQSSEVNATPQSSPTPSPPAAPTNLSATGGDGSVSLSWSASSGATSYKVFRGTSPGGEGASPVGTPTGTSFNDTGLVNGTTYYYKVRATNANGDSPLSSEVSATPQAAAVQQQPPPSTTTAQVPPFPLPPQLIPTIAALDTTPPTLTIARVGKQTLANALKRGVLLDLSCSEPCSMAVTLLLDFKTAHALHLAAKKPVKVGARSVALGKAGHVKVRVPFSAKAKKRLRNVKALRITVQIAGADSLGNRATKTKRLALR